MCIRDSFIFYYHTKLHVIAPTVLQSGIFGGGGGEAFDDLNDNFVGIVGMNIRSNVFVNNTQVFYQGASLGTADPLSTFTLADGKKLIRMDGMIGGELIGQLTFTSNFNCYNVCSMYGPYGSTGEIPFSVEGSEILAIFGGSFMFLDAIGVYYINSGG